MKSKSYILKAKKELLIERILGMIYERDRLNVELRRSRPETYSSNKIKYRNELTKRIAHSRTELKQLRVDLNKC